MEAFVLEELEYSTKNDIPYQFVDFITEEEYAAFVQKHKKSHILQSSEWGKFKASLGNWKTYRVGIRQGDELCAATMILIRKLPFPFSHKSFAYAPRGFVVDFKDKDMIQYMTKEMISFLKTEQVVFLRIDPDLLYRERDINGNIQDDGQNNQQIVSFLKELGYSHQGTELDFGGFQPRFTFRLALHSSSEGIFRNFSKNTQYKVRLAERRGVEIIEGEKEDLLIFQWLNEITAKRDGFIPRPITYFQKMYDILAPKQHMKLFLAKYNLEKGLNYITGEIQKRESQISSSTKIKAKQIDIQNQLEKLYKEKESLQNLQKNHPNGFVLSAAIEMIYGNKAWYLYGASENNYRNLMPNYLLQWHMIKEAKSRNCDIYDFFGVSGNLSEDHPLYGLYKFKRGFRGDFTEFVGEFDLVLSKFYYSLFHIIFPRNNKRKKIIKFLDWMKSKLQKKRES